MRNDTPEPEDLAEAGQAGQADQDGQAVPRERDDAPAGRTGGQDRAAIDGQRNGAGDARGVTTARGDGPAGDEADVIRRAQAGDRQALGILVRRYQRRVFALGIRFFGNKDDAEDLVQDTFVRAWRGLDRFDLTRPFAPWLMRIASNRALTEIATRKRRAGVELDESMAWDGPGADEDLERRELQRRVGRALHELPEDQRLILLLRVSDGMSYRDIAASLDIPVGTVMSRLSRAREAMRRKVKQR